MNDLIETKKEISLELTSYLQQKETEIKTTLTSTVYKVGKILKDVSGKLKNENVDFTEWVISIGISPPAAKNYIRYFEICDKNPEKLKILPQNLVLELGKEDTPKQIVEKVITGDIKTIKELKELKRQYKELSEHENESSSKINQLTEENEKLKQEKSKLGKDYMKIIDVKNELQLKVEKSEGRNKAELRIIFIEINSFIGEKIPKAKYYMEKLEKNEADKELKNGLDDIRKTLSLLSEV